MLTYAGVNTRAQVALMWADKEIGGLATHEVRTCEGLIH
jgi:hypothetical protein